LGGDGSGGKRLGDYGSGGDRSGDYGSGGDRSGEDGSGGDGSGKNGSVGDGSVRNGSVRNGSVAKKVAADPPSFNWFSHKVLVHVQILICIGHSLKDKTKIIFLSGCSGEFHETVEI
jgi:hypothetical protein